MIASTIGMKNTKWARLTIIMFAFWTFLTGVCCFQKADFLNLTVGMMGLFIMLDP